jgi:hypothetical protein
VLSCLNAFLWDEGKKRQRSLCLPAALLWLLTACTAASLAGRPGGSATQRRGYGGLPPAVADVARTECAFCPPHIAVAVRVCGSWQNIRDDAGWVAHLSGGLRRVKGRAARQLWLVVGGGRRRWARVVSSDYAFIWDDEKRRQHTNVVCCDLLWQWLLTGSFAAALAGHPDGMTATLRRGYGGL